MFKRIPGKAAAIFVLGMGMQCAHSQEAQGFRVDIDSSHLQAKADEASHFRCGAPHRDTPYDIDVHSPVDEAQGLGKFAVNVTKDGGWIPRHANFTAPDTFIMDRHFGNTHLIGALVANGDSVYDVDLTQAGVITATQTGTTNKLTNLKFAYPLTGTVTWRATETIDLHTGADKWDFHADMDATYRTTKFSPTCTYTGTLDAHATSTRAIKLPPQVIKG
jgi:hypothetical protein